VKIRSVTENYNIWACWGGPDSTLPDPPKWALQPSGAMKPVWLSDGAQSWGEGRGIIQDRRGSGLGFRILAEKSQQLDQHLTHTEVTSDQYDAFRRYHDIPEGVDEIVPMKAFPMEANLDLMGAINFKKGCYVGQELTVRTYHTGAIRKRIFPIRIPKRDPKLESTLPEQWASSISGADIAPVRTQKAGSGLAKPRGHGTLLSWRNSIGLALLRLDHVTAVQNGDLEFKMTLPGSDSTVTVVPSLPEWWPQLVAGKGEPAPVNE